MKVGRSFLLADYFDGRQRWLLSMSDAGATLEAVDELDNQPAPDGFAHFVETRQGPKFIGYLSRDRNAAGDAPDYARSLVVVVDNAFYGIEATQPQLSWRRGLSRRRLVIAGASSNVILDYEWPFYRELFARAFGDPFTFQSKDFISELIGLVRFYRPSWISSST